MAQAAAQYTRTDFDTRAVLEAIVERALSLIDAIDGDPDLEPSFGGGLFDLHLGSGALDECEPDNDDEEDDPAEDDDSGIGDEDGLWEVAGEHFRTLPAERAWVRREAARLLERQLDL